MNSANIGCYLTLSLKIMATTIEACEIQMAPRVSTLIENWDLHRRQILSCGVVAFQLPAVSRRRASPSNFAASHGNSLPVSQLARKTPNGSGSAHFAYRCRDCLELAAHATESSPACTH